jgi:anthranilate/para-aminobenzoate synthase component II
LLDLLEAFLARTRLILGVCLGHRGLVESHAASWRSILLQTHGQGLPRSSITTSLDPPIRLQSPPKCHHARAKRELRAVR